MSKLTFRYEYESPIFPPEKQPDDLGRLFMTAQTAQFSGSGDFCVYWQDVVALGDELKAYPIKPDQPIVRRWGFEQGEGDDTILALEIAPSDSIGGLAVRFIIADQFEPQYRVAGHFTTNYSDIERFSNDIVLLMKRDIEEAVLIGQ
jgi:hypothetical protein